MVWAITLIRAEIDDFVLEIELPLRISAVICPWVLSIELARMFMFGLWLAQRKCKGTVTPVVTRASKLTALVVESTEELTRVFMPVNAELIAGENVPSMMDVPSSVASVPFSKVDRPDVKTVEVEKQIAAPVPSADPRARNHSTAQAFLPTVARSLRFARIFFRQQHRAQHCAVEATRVKRKERKIIASMTAAPR